MDVDNFDVVVTSIATVDAVKDCCCCNKDPGSNNQIISSKVLVSITDVASMIVATLSG